MENLTRESKEAIAGTGRPKAGYRLADGSRVPGVTTIVGRFKDSGGLIYWAWDQGRNGKDFRETRDAAAEAGGIAHDLIEADIHRRPTPLFVGVTQDLLNLAHTAFDAYQEWRTQVNLEVLETEVPLVSEAHRFGGTFDALARINGKLMLFDWKTSNAVYGDYIAQVGAYSYLLEERGTAVEGAQLLRFGKEFADFHVHYYPAAVLAMGLEYFSLARRMYDIDASLKKIAA